MTGTLLSCSQLVFRFGALSALTLFTTAACTAVHYIYPRNVQGFVLPTGCPSGSAPADTTELNACLTGIEFDTTETLGDKQRLMVRDSGGPGLPCFGDSTHTCRYGPLATIQPVKGAETYSDSALNQGRIIARMFLGPQETETYQKFELAPGDTTYWWVDAVHNTSKFVHRKPGVAITNATTRALTRKPHGKGSFQQAATRWVWDDTDEKVNGTCGSSCCR